MPATLALTESLVMSHTGDRWYEKPFAKNIHFRELSNFVDMPADPDPLNWSEVMDAADKEVTTKACPDCYGGCSAPLVESKN